MGGQDVTSRAMASCASRTLAWASGGPLCAASGGAAGEVRVERAEGERLQRVGGVGDVCEDVDAALVLLDSPL